MTRSSVRKLIVSTPQPDAVSTTRLAAARPLLPRAEEILPYLQRIDAQRWYSNSGPLLREFEERL